jgi:predicted nucleic acid-binding protein
MKTLSGVLDANVVIGLSKGGIIHHLSSLYSALYIPSAVKQEVISQGQGRAGVKELTQSLGVWITEVVPDPRRVQQLATALRSEADRQVLALAQEKAVDHVLTGDERLHREASHRGLVCLRAVDVVVLLRMQGIVTEVKSVLDRMRQEGLALWRAPTGQPSVRQGSSYLISLEQLLFLEECSANLTARQPA